VEVGCSLQNLVQCDINLREFMPKSFFENLAVSAAPGVFVILWASGFIGAKFGMPYAEPMTFLFYRMLAVVMLIGGIVLATRPAWPNRAGMIHSAITGLFVHGCYLGGVFVALDHKLPAGLVALVVSLQPVLTSTLANRLLGERVLPQQWAGLGLGIVGVYFVVQGRTEGEASLFAWAAAMFALIGMTIGTLYQRRYGGAIDWRSNFLLQYSAAAVAFGVGALLFETREVHWTPEFVFALAWLVLALSFGAIWLLYFLIKRQAAARVVSLFYLTPPFTALMAWAMFGERLTLIAVVGMVICAIGVALVNWRAGTS
jgi:drug/metabolite transporter (DMT)-like permease